MKMIIEFQNKMLNEHEREKDREWKSVHVMESGRYGELFK
jgi:hypothetical protein